MKPVDDESVDLVVTSPPYPMIEMWDDAFASQDRNVKDALDAGNGDRAFELMHGILDIAWLEINRVLKRGGIACINIGNATRTIDATFKMYPNNARIVATFLGLGFGVLPEILWRKQSNAPNKFMGSGMMPPGAYITLEHEYILIFRKGGKREFGELAEKANRLRSAYFWEERNAWFSDVWFDLKGAPQKMIDLNLRARSAAFPFELPYRLVNMFSVRGDTVLDPFAGTGTTMIAAMVSGRNSTGIESDPHFKDTIATRARDVPSFSKRVVESRLSKHLGFVNQRTSTIGALKYVNVHHEFPVMTRQEIELMLPHVLSVVLTRNDKACISFEADVNDIVTRTEAKSLLAFLDKNEQGDDGCGKQDKDTGTLK